MHYTWPLLVTRKPDKKVLEGLGTLNPSTPEHVAGAAKLEQAPPCSPSQMGLFSEGTKEVHIRPRSEREVPSVSIHICFLQSPPSSVPTPNIFPSSRTAPTDAPVCLRVQSKPLGLPFQVFHCPSLLLHISRPSPLGSGLPASLMCCFFLAPASKASSSTTHPSHFYF